jgi:hypothetical protein
VTIRHFGFLANRNRSSALALCRQSLAGENDEFAGQCFVTGWKRGSVRVAFLLNFPD